MYIYLSCLLNTNFPIDFVIGITLVITPLVSLMEDQLAGLEKLGIKAAKLNASSTKEEVNMVHTVCGKIHIYSNLLLFTL